MAAKKKDLKETVEQGIRDVLEAKDEPSDGRLKALALGIKMCALNAKLEESEYGDFFNPAEQTGPTGSVPPEGKRAARKRANGGDGEPELPL
jgi:hypothetical protein